MVKYYYEGYGNLINIIDTSGIGLGTLNPFRYRSYYYDNETGWYYLNTRFYDPLIKRFITPDDISYLGSNSNIVSYNLYNYCGNNPVIMADYNGNDAIYVVDFEWPSGLPVVGHAVLYYQTKDKKWHSTEFSKEDNNMKPHIINCDLGDYDAVLNEIDKYKIKVQYIEGDFSKIYDYANYWSGTDFGGYKPLTNNCLHYVHYALNYAKFGSTSCLNIKINTIKLNTFIPALYDFNRLFANYKNKLICNIKAHSGGGGGLFYTCLNPFDQILNKYCLR